MQNLHHIKKNACKVRVGLNYWNWMKKPPRPSGTRSPSGIPFGHRRGIVGGSIAACASYSPSGSLPKNVYPKGGVVSLPEASEELSEADSWLGNMTLGGGLINHPVRLRRPPLQWRGIKTAVMAALALNRRQPPVPPTRFMPTYGYPLENPPTSEGIPKGRGIPLPRRGARRAGWWGNSPPPEWHPKGGVVG